MHGEALEPRHHWRASPESGATTAPVSTEWSPDGDARHLDNQRSSHRCGGAPRRRGGASYSDPG